MTIDEAIAHARKVAKENRYEHFTFGIEKCKQCAQEQEQLVEWLEQLKIFKECNISKINFENGYNKAIDDYVERLKETFKPCKEADNYIYTNVCKRFDDIAQQLKAGGIDG